MDLSSCNGVSECQTSLRSICDFSLRVTDKWQWSVEKVNKLLEDTRATLAERKQHVYYYVYVDDRSCLPLSVADVLCRVIICAKKP
jgi:hypothetical protein